LYDFVLFVIFDAFVPFVISFVIRNA